MDDAEATVKFAIRNAIADTAHVTGVRAGDASKQLVQAIHKGVLDPAVRRARLELADKI
jgi:hypothetical protein